MKFVKILIIVFAMLALIAGVWVGYFSHKKELSAVESSTIFSPPHDMVAFSLIDTQGRTFDNNALWGHWTFLIFGFTQCAQICLPTMTELNQVYQQFLKTKQDPMPKMVFISIDPQHDTLEKLGNYVQSFNPHFQGATGDQKQLDQLTESISMLFTKTKDKKMGEDTLEHSGAILLLDPSGKIAAIFSAPFDPQALAKDFNLIVTNSG